MYHLFYSVGRFRKAYSTIQAYTNGSISIKSIGCKPLTDDLMATDSRLPAITIFSDVQPSISAACPTVMTAYRIQTPFSVDAPRDASAVMFTLRRTDAEDDNICTGFTAPNSTPPIVTPSLTTRNAL
ncbi:MAG: hypothetical protein ACI9JP_004115 [Granulosicoccus sp.]|jgi:hypothetical protein